MSKIDHVWLRIGLTLCYAVSFTQCLECLACSYTFAGEDGLTDIQCVNDSSNFAKTVYIQCPQQCLTRVVYTAQFKKITSISRGCTEQFYDGNRCDRADSFAPTCVESCSTTRCNNKPFYNNKEVIDANGTTSIQFTSSSMYLCIMLLALYKNLS